MELVILAGIIGLVLWPWLRGKLLQQGASLSQNPPLDPQKAAALARVRQLKYFYIHLAFYLFMLACVWVMLQVLDGRQESIRMIVLAWSFILALHAFVVFVIQGSLIKNWENRRIKAIMKKNDD